MLNLGLYQRSINNINVLFLFTNIEPTNQLLVIQENFLPLLDNLLAEIIVASCSKSCNFMEILVKTTTLTIFKINGFQWKLTHAKIQQSFNINVTFLRNLNHKTL